MKSDYKFEAVFARRLEDTLVSKGLDASDVEFAGVIGSENSIKAYINGYQIPNLRTAVRLAKYLNVSLDYLCGMDEDDIWFDSDRQKQLLAPWLREEIL